MNITVYNMSDDKRTLNKNLGTAVVTYTGVHLKDDSDLINPVFRLSKLQDSGGHVTKVNYLYSPFFDRYYFIENVKYCTGGIIELECHVDVLQSFKTEILAKSAYVTRQEKGSEKKNYFYDSSHPIRSDVTTYPIKIGTVGAGHGYYLTVNGGVQ